MQVAQMDVCRWQPCIGSEQLKQPFALILFVLSVGAGLYEQRCFEASGPARSRRAQVHL
jgi:hypothetical protein